MVCSMFAGARLRRDPNTFQGVLGTQDPNHCSAHLGQSPHHTPNDNMEESIIKTPLKRLYRRRRGSLLVLGAMTPIQKLGGRRILFI